jgi:hypothetical protein
VSTARPAVPATRLDITTDRSSRDDIVKLVSSSPTTASDPLALRRALGLGDARTVLAAYDLLVQVHVTGVDVRAHQLLLDRRGMTWRTSGTPS